VYTKDYPLHQIKFPTEERIVSNVPPPAQNILTDQDFWLEPHKPNVALIKDHLKREGRVSKEQIHTLVDLVCDIFSGEDNVLFIEAPVTICGDIHGQYYDLLKLLEIGGDPANVDYLFLGDYVDRGNFSIECVILIFCYKLLYPNRFWMLRGNHECRHLTNYFTFREECEYKYDIDVYDSVMDAFDALPLAAIMNNQFFCVHGGLSPDLETIEDIMKIDRFTEPPPNGPMCDLLWADPLEDFSPEVEADFVPNTVRGCSYNFSFNAVCDFLARNKLLSVIRAHEAQDAGYRMHRRNEETGFPSLITLFSAPNYLDAYNNKGAIMKYENNVINIRQFNHSPHPYYLPGFMDVFSWSLPFVADKMAELLYVITNLVDDASAEKAEIEALKVHEEKERKREAVRNKIRTVSRMLRLFKSMKEEREQEGSPHSSPTKTLAAPPTIAIPLPSDLKDDHRRESIDKGVGGFDGTRLADRPNEARPTLIIENSVPASPDGLRRSLNRRASRDHILGAKKMNVEFHAKITEASDSGKQRPLPKMVTEHDS